MGLIRHATAMVFVPITLRQKGLAAVLQNTRGKPVRNAPTAISAMPLWGNALHALVVQRHRATTKAPATLRLGSVLVQLDGTMIPTAQLALVDFGAIGATLVQKMQ